MSEPDPVAVVSEPDPAAEPVADPDPVVAEPEPSVVPDPPLSFLHAGVITKQSPKRTAANFMTGMLHGLRQIGLGLAIVLGFEIVEAAPDLKLPPGTRTDASGQLVSSRGLRETTEFIAKELERRGIATKKVGPIRVRGVELTRFISETPSTSWLAIHVMRTAGKTVIFFVPRPGS